MLLYRHGYTAGTNLARQRVRRSPGGTQRVPVLPGLVTPIDSEGGVGQAFSPESKESAASAKTSRRARGGFAFSFTVQAVLAVVVAHALALPLLYSTWLGGRGFAPVALALSCIALALLGWRWSRLIAAMRATLQLFGAFRDEPSARTDAHSPGLEGLQRSLESVHRRVARRVAKLKAARDAAELDASSQRTLAQQLTRAQRIARVGGWEWERGTDDIVCSSEVYRILGVDEAVFRPRPASIQTFIHPEDRRAFRRWLIKLARGTDAEGMDLRIVARGNELRHVHLLGEGLSIDGGRIIGVAGTIQDATERTRAIQQIHRLAYFDVLTEPPTPGFTKTRRTLEAAKRRQVVAIMLWILITSSGSTTAGHACRR
jgi:PAS domain-containing protein